MRDRTGIEPHSWKGAGSPARWAAGSEIGLNRALLPCDKKGSDNPFTNYNKTVGRISTIRTCQKVWVELRGELSGG